MVRVLYIGAWPHLAILSGQQRGALLRQRLVAQSGKICVAALTAIFDFGASLLMAYREGLMNVYILVAHPEPNSFNASLVETARKAFIGGGHRVKVSDLYQNKFDPCERSMHFENRSDESIFDVQAEQRHAFENDTLPMDVQHELELVQWADLIMVQFPLWWFGPPAMLKGWMDRVFVYGALYSSERRFERGRCRGKRMLLSVTTGASVDECSYNGRELNTRMLLWPIQYAFRYVGFDVLRAHLIHGVWSGRSDMAQAMGAEMRNLATFCSRIDEAPLLSFNTPIDWDESGRLKPYAASVTPFIQHGDPWSDVVTRL
ncbi:flavodoxin family protein [Burkholderia sp. Nafp2/4-1b]|uniref:NAD(P)H-dependent oxidoreductase n=1 Tax=Burkholderia sp. Nafp2/4-1b TaxID=2116686 RepID=UPI000EF8CF7F|nr:NAD(P)H-dependent oxidoreductase [Burkholderia sp. Nafp2/4-1b]RKT98701.1 flavodoxin family protein [Burkholderia sp. Nafp2/4-1b]